MAKESVDYESGAVPADYRCRDCGATGCKLWREYQTWHPDLLCAVCAGADQKRDVSSMDAQGRRLTPEYDWSEGQRSDQIGWYVPAVPDEEGVGYWGYTAVPARGVAWWKRLPLAVPR